jgi:hypothetical protein
LLCRAHNSLMAERDFGPLFVQRARSCRQGGDAGRS